MEQQANYIDERIRQVVVGSQTALMDKLDNLISSKLANFETKISESQRQISDSQLNKIQENILCNDNYAFKRKSCEDQFKFNLKVVGKLKDAEARLAAEVKDIPKASKDISEGITLLNHRQKLIKLADSSDMGWKVVKEYEANPLASDSEDEKRINKAKVRAVKKHKQDQVKRTRKSTRFSSYPTTQQQAKDAGTGQRYATPSASASKPGLCFSCGQTGRWKFECPQKRQASKWDKISESFRQSVFAGVFYHIEDGFNIPFRITETLAKDVACCLLF